MEVLEGSGRFRRFSTRFEVQGFRVALSLGTVSGRCKWFGRFRLEGLESSGSFKRFWKV